MLELTFFSKLDWGTYIVFIANTASKESGTLIHSIMSLSLEHALYLYKSSIWSCMEYCCHGWAVVPSCYLNILDKLQKWVCRTFGAALHTSLEPVGHWENVASLKGV